MFKIHRIWDIRAAIAIPSVALVLVVVVTLGFLAMENVRSTLEFEKDARLHVVAMQADRINSDVVDSLAMLDAVAVSGQLSPGQPAGSDIAVLDGLLRGHEGLWSVALLDSHGVPLAQRPIDREPASSLADSGWLASLLSGSGPSVGNLPVRSPYSRSFLVLGSPVMDVSGKQVGAIVALMDLSSLEIGRSMGGVLYGATGYSSLISSDGTVVASSKPDRLFTKSEFADEVPALLKGGHPVISPQNDKGQPSGEEVVAVAVVPAANLLVTNEQDADEFYAPLSAVRNGFLAAGAVLILLALAIGIGASRLLGDPIRKLSKVARRMSSGELDEEVPEFNLAEVSDLGIAIGDMQHKLKTRIDRLRVVGNLGALTGEELRPEVIFDRFAKELAGLIPYDRADLFTIDRSLGQARLVYSSGASAVELSQGALFSVADNAIFSSQECHLGGDLPSGRLGPLEEAMARIGMKSGVAVALKSGGQTSGLIVLWSVSKGAFSDDDMEVLNPLASQLSAAVANARLFTQIEQAKREWEKTFDSMSEGIALISPERRVLRVNLALARMLGSTNMKEFVGQQCHRLVHGLDNPPLNCPTCASLLSRLPSEVVWKEPHLGGRWFKLRGDPMLDAQGNVIQLVHTFTDVTDEKRHQEALELLHNMSKVLSSTLDLQQILHLAVREIRGIFGGSEITVGIALLDDSVRGFTIKAALGARQKEWEGVPLTLEQLPPEAVRTLLEQRLPWAQSDFALLPRADRGLSGVSEHSGLAAVPLVSGDKVIGLVFLATGYSGSPSGEEIDLLETCAGEIARAVQNAQLFTSTDVALRSRVAEQEALAAMLVAATMSLDFDTVLKDVLKRASGALNVDSAGIALVADSENKMTTQAVYDRKTDSFRAVDTDLDIVSLPTLQSLMDNGSPLVVPDVRMLPPGPEKSLAEQWRVRSALVVPIIFAGKKLGILNFALDSEPRTYSSADILLASAIANNLASVVESAKLNKREVQERSTLAAVISGMAEGLVVLDKNRRIAFFNPAAELLTGVNASEVAGQNIDVFRDMFFSRVVDAEGLRAAWAEALTRLDQMPKFQSEIMTGADKRIVEAALFQIGDRSNPLGTGALLRDVTRERETDRMKTEFVATVSHELRTPLTSIYGFSELLLMRATNLSENQRSWVETIHKESKRLSDIVNDLLDVSRIEAGRLSLAMRPVAVRPLVMNIIGVVRQGRASRDITLEMPEIFPDLQADPEKLQQVLFNLVDNAVKYSPKGGAVVVSVRLDAAPGRAVVSVSDKGLGIREDEIPKLFTRFYRIQRPEVVGLRGTGLGLYIVKSLVEMMGGNIWLESKFNEGSTFFVSLPIAVPPSDSPGTDTMEASSQGS